jgi:hypothetical protein
MPTLTPAAPPSELVVAARGALQAAVAAPADGLTAAADLHELVRIQAMAAAAIAERLAVVDRQHTWQDTGSRAQWAWLQRHLDADPSDEPLAPISQSDASALVKLSHDLDVQPVVAAGLRSGRLSQRHCTVLGKALRQLGRLVMGTSWNNPEWLAAQEQAFVNLAVTADPARLQRELRKRLQALAPEPAIRDDEERLAKRRASVTPGFDGMWNVNAELDPHSGQILRAAVDAWRRTDHHAGDTRTPAQRDHDALVGMARAWLDSGTTSQRGATPHLIITVPEARLTAHAHAHESGCPGPTRPTVGSPAPPAGEALPDPFTQPLLTDPTGQLLTPGEVHDLVQTQAPPGLEAPGLEALVPPATYPDGTPVPERTLSLLLCDSRLTRLVLDTKSQPLDVGRSERIHSWGMWIAAMHQWQWQCAVEGCTAPASRLELHHPTWWRNQGETSLANSVPLCHGNASCHTRVHEGKNLLLRDGRMLTPTGLSSPSPADLRTQRRRRRTSPTAVRTRATQRLLTIVSTTPEQLAHRDAQRLAQQIEALKRDSRLLSAPDATTL